MKRDLEHRAAFEQFGETHVRVLAQQNDRVGKEAVAWLQEQEVLRQDAYAKIRDAREEKTLALAKEANEIARHSADSTRKSAVAVARSVKISVVALLVAIASAVATWIAASGK